MAMDWVDELLAHLREEVEKFRRYGDDTRAATCEVIIDEILARRSTFLGEELTLRDAARESGFSEKHLSRLAKAGVITLRRGDLPRRPGHGVRRGPRPVPNGSTDRDGQPDIAGRVIAARARVGAAAR